jgi:hypothetical protein
LVVSRAPGLLAAETYCKPIDIVLPCQDRHSRSSLPRKVDQQPYTLRRNRDDLLQPQTSALRRSRIKRRQADRRGYRTLPAPLNCLQCKTDTHALRHFIIRRSLDAQAHVLRGSFTERALLSTSWYFPFFDDYQTMMPKLGLAAIAASWITAANGFNTDDQVNPSIPFGSFENPSSHVRPRFR